MRLKCVKGNNMDKIIHLLAEDKHYCCSFKAKTKPDNSTSNPEKVTCNNCKRVIEAYKTNVFYREAYMLNRGVGIEL